MSLQTGVGPIVVDANDAQITYRGVTIAVKARSVQWMAILGCIKQPDGTWKADADLTGELFSTDPYTPEYVLNQYGSAQAFVVAVVMPELNKWLAQLFGPAELSAAEQIAMVLGAIKFTSQSDGTLMASL